MKEIFRGLGLQESRMKLSWISASEGQKFARVSREFTEEMQELGENPVKRELFI